MNPYELIEKGIAEASSLKDSLNVLEHLLSGGYSVWTDGSLYEVRQLVEEVRGLRIEVFAKEHPPPHFHISGGNIDAVFSIADCQFLEGRIGGRERRLVEWWYQRSRLRLIEAWNSTRPSDCPVGPILD